MPSEQQALSVRQMSSSDPPQLAVQRLMKELPLARQVAGLQGCLSQHDGMERLLRYETTTTYGLQTYSWIGEATRADTTRRTGHTFLSPTLERLEPVRVFSCKPSQSFSKKICNHYH